ELMQSCFAGVKRSYMEMLGLLPTLSKLGEPDEFYKLQTIRPICLNHCPLYASSTVSVSLHCSIFGKFKDFCEEAPEKEKEYSFHVTNFLCFLVTIAGPYFSVSGAVLSDIAIIDPLTPMYPLIWQKNNEMMVSISRMFRALKKSLKLLEEHYKHVDELAQDISRTAHPVHLSFPDVVINGKQYSVQFDSDSQVGVFLLWKVGILDTQEIYCIAYVRAVQKHQYSLDTYWLLADAEYAPKVFATSVIPRNWLLVYIEHLDNHSMLSHITINLNNQEQDDLKKKIEIVVKYLHDLEHVHGDLCEDNILVRQLENNEFDVKLIDFEWFGKIGSAHYSHFMNHVSIKWPYEAEDEKLVTKNHDMA
ncbi:31075_t:CDS:2, partial [Racocetra persica]